MQFFAMLQETPAPTGSFSSTIIMFALIFVIMYFFLIRPQNKKQKETEKMIAALKKGDKVVTIGGIHGTVASTKEKTVILKVEDGSKIEFNRTAISTVIVDKVEAPKASKKASKKAAEKEAAAEAPKDASETTAEPVIEETKPQTEEKTETVETASTEETK